VNQASAVSGGIINQSSAGLFIAFYNVIISIIPQFGCCFTGYHKNHRHHTPGHFFWGVLR
jgi:hypothetical protein